ncbi:MAG TPA: hypothetical protein PKJ95_05170 [Atribacterota bacterium]|nr:hypothetical protein [Atribacterota bacterium]
MEPGIYLKCEAGERYFNSVQDLRRAIGAENLSHPNLWSLNMWELILFYTEVIMKERKAVITFVSRLKYIVNFYIDANEEKIHPMIAWRAERHGQLKLF